MRDRVNIDNQLENNDMFKLALSFGMGDFVLDSLKVGIRNSLNVAGNLPVNNRPVKSYTLYKSHLKIFKEIQEKHIALNDLLPLLGIDIEQLKANKEQVKEAVKDSDGFLLSLANRLDKNSLTEMNNMIGFNYTELNRILQGIDDYKKTEETVPKLDDATKRIVLERLYVDACEAYKKVLVEMYRKIKKIKDKDRVNMKELYTYYDKNYPILLKDFNRRLRNDVSHLLYNERDKYTNEKLYSESKRIFIKTVAGVMSKNHYYYKILSNGIKTIKASKKKLKKIESKVNK